MSSALQSLPFGEEVRQQQQQQQTAAAAIEGFNWGILHTILSCCSPLQIFPQTLLATFTNCECSLLYSVCISIALSCPAGLLQADPKSANTAAQVLLHGYTGHKCKGDYSPAPPPLPTSPSLPPAQQLDNTSPTLPSSLQLPPPPHSQQLDPHPLHSLPPVLPLPPAGPVPSTPSNRTAHPCESR